MVGRGNQIGLCSDLLAGVCNRDAKACKTDHADVVLSVAKGNDLFRRNAQLPAQLSERTLLARFGRDALDILGPGNRADQAALKALFDLFQKLGRLLLTKD